MSITTTHFSNFKLRVHLLAWAILICTLLGAWIGHQHARSDMQPDVEAAFNRYLHARVPEILGLDRLTLQRSDNRHTRYLTQLRTEQNGHWAAYFEQQARVAYMYLPIACGIVGAILAIAIGRSIGRVQSRSL